MPNVEAVIKLNPTEGGIEIALEDLERRVQLTGNDAMDAPYYCGSNG
ncbi:MAG TPA: hypothetical protein VGD01_08305 [Candidatus Elarobacter sp.]|jgi:hypothetical protein